MISELGLFDDCWSDKDFAEQRGKSQRFLRSERQQGKGPPYIKDGCRVWYPKAAAREWLLKQMHEPVRESPQRQPVRARSAVEPVA